jgi:hypothetical protein
VVAVSDDGGRDGELLVVGPAFGRISVYGPDGRWRLLGYAQRISDGWVVGVTGRAATTIVSTAEEAKAVLRAALLGGDGRGPGGGAG